MNGSTYSMAAESALAGEYAKALLPLTPGAERARRIGEGLDALASAAAADETVSRFLLDPTVDPSDKRLALRAALASSPEPLLLDFLSVVVENGRGGLIGPIADAYRAALAEREGQVLVTVQSAVALTEAARGQVRQVLSEVLGETRQPVIEEQIDASLVGGLRIRVGDRVIDATVRGMLDRLAGRLKSRPEDAP